MLSTKVVIARPVKVILNTGDRKSVAQWGQIKDAVTGKVLHTGQVPYIRSLARKRYNTQVVG
jgi:hypothetical protein